MLPSSIIPPSFTSHALQLLQRVQLGISPVELIYAHEHWPFQPGRTTHARPTLRISVLDSSFNPPTLAHLALANSLPPSSQASSHHSPISPAPAEPYDAQILLLSVRNADKVLKPGDAKLVQRLEMMHLLSHDMRSVESIGSGSKSSCMNGIAIAVIDEPTFVGKSTVLLRFLQARLAALIESHSPNTGSISADNQYTSYPVFPAPKLTFLLGFDTLVRLFSSKYYPSHLVMVQLLRTFLSQDQEDCHLVCAYRQSASASKMFQETQDEFDIVPQFITSGRITFIDIGAEEQTYSSTDVRTRIMSRNESWKRLVTNTVADYILSQGLYSR